MGKGKVIVDADWCKSCGYCLMVCPKGVLGVSGDVNRFGYRYVSPLKPEECIGCGLCATMCPDIAIEVSKED